MPQTGSLYSKSRCLYCVSFSDLRNKFREGIAKISGFDIKSLPEDDEELIDSAYRSVNEIMNLETEKVTQDELRVLKEQTNIFQMYSQT